MKRYANQTHNTPIVQAAIPLLPMAALPMNSSMVQLPSLIIKSNGEPYGLRTIKYRKTIPKSSVQSILSVLKQKFKSSEVAEICTISCTTVPYH